MLYQLYPRYYFSEESHRHRIDRITGQVDKILTLIRNTMSQLPALSENYFGNG